MIQLFLFFANEMPIENVFYYITIFPKSSLFFRYFCSACGSRRFFTNVSIILLAWLIRINVRYLLHCERLSFFEIVTMIDFVHISGQLLFSPYIRKYHVHYFNHCLSIIYYKFEWNIVKNNRITFI